MAINCLSNYDCNGLEINKPWRGAVYTPYLEVTVGGERVLLTGNESCPIGDAPHHAMITSFQYGTQSGTGSCGCTIEVTDEGGKLYEKVYRALNKDITKTADESLKCKANFGWRIVDCNGIPRLITNEKEPTFPAGGGGELHFLPRKLSANFDGGLIKFTLECVDLFSARSGEARLESNIGTEDGKVELKSALQQLFTEYDPKFKSVNYYRSNGQGAFTFRNDHGGANGYQSVHNMDQESNISCARKWVNNTTTEEKNGIFIMYNPHDASACFYEDPGNPSDCCDATRNIGTFIVNGGNNSNVISFNPSFEWNFGANSGTGGVASGGGSADMGETVKAGETSRDNLVKTGSQSQHLADGNTWHWQTPESHAFQANESFTIHNDATRSYENMIAPIQAELKIIGDPRFVNPLFLTAKWVSIVVIDPFYIEKAGGDSSGCEWLSTSNCNPILSNKKWMIMGVDHQITSGSYFTTLKVRLDTPGINIDSGNPLGGCGPAPVESSNTNPKF